MYNNLIINKHMNYVCNDRCKCFVYTWVQLANQLFPPFIAANVAELNINKHNLVYSYSLINTNLNRLR